MRIIMFAGSGTMTKILTFALLELARNPEYQHRLCAEIRAAERDVSARGAEGIALADVEAMPFLQAFIKEVIRFHPVAPYLYRRPIENDVLPLSTPITTRSGKVIREVPIPKGLRLVLSIPRFNSDPTIWGEDAHVFNPERYLKSERNGPTGFGLYANTMTFGAGVRGCIGWRFALYELQAFLVSLVSHFNFSPTEDIVRLRKEHAGSMVAMLDGETEKGAQLPLCVSLAARD